MKEKVAGATELQLTTWRQLRTNCWSDCKAIHVVQQTEHTRKLEQCLPFSNIASKEWKEGNGKSHWPRDQFPGSCTNYILELKVLTSNHGKAGPQKVWGAGKVIMRPASFTAAWKKQVRKQSTSGHDWKPSAVFAQIWTSWVWPFTSKNKSMK